MLGETCLDLVAAAGKWWVEYFQISFLVYGVLENTCVCHLRWAFARAGHPDMKRSRTSRRLIAIAFSQEFMLMFMWHVMQLQIGTPPLLLICVLWILWAEWKHGTGVTLANIAYLNQFGSSS